jgi:hypothetical protein
MATAPKPAPKSADSIVTKLCRVALKIESVEKKGYNDHHKYAYIREAELTSAARGLLAEEGLWIIPAVTGLERTGSLVTLKMDFQLIDGASGESLHIPWFAEGSDASDKGVNKALTNGLKYLLYKLMLIPAVGDTGEYSDAENTRYSAPVEREVATKTDPPAADGLYIIKALEHKQSSKGEFLLVTLHDGRKASVAAWDMEEVGTAVSESYTSKSPCRLRIEARGDYLNIKGCDVPPAVTEAPPDITADDVPF